MNSAPWTPPTPDAAVLGLDNVRLELPLAGLGSRSLALLLDGFLLLCLLLVWLAGGLTVMRYLETGGGWIAGILILGVFVVQWGYFAVFEIVMDGRTPGKLAVGLRVVAHHGGRSSVVAILVRNVLRGLDLITGLPAMAMDRRCRRLGDMVAGTVVVHHREPQGEAEEVRLQRLPASWGTREIVVMESFLRRANRLVPARAAAMAGQLLEWLEREEPELVAAAETELTDLAQTDPILMLRRIFAAETP